jgi:hypothetical protein
MVEVLLRRLVSEPGFHISSEEVDRFALGVALDSEISKTYLLRPTELFALMYLKVVDNDFIPEKRRALAVEKIIACLDALALNDLGGPRPNRLKVFYRDAALLLGLGLVATVPVSTIVAIASPIVVDSWSNLSTFVQTSVLGTIFCVFSVTGALALLLLLKDREAEDLLPDRKSNDFAHQILRRLKPTRMPSVEEPGLGLILEAQSGRIILDARREVPSHSQVSRIVKRMQKALLTLNCDRGYLVFGGTISEAVRSLSSEGVRIVTIDEFMRSLTTPIPGSGLSSARNG